MQCPYRIELFGRLRVSHGDRVITRFQTQKTGALLACLACFPDRAHPREELIERLWPEVEPTAGRNRLKQALSALRRQLEPPSVPAGTVLVTDRFTARVNPAAVTTDVAEFAAALRAAVRVTAPSERIPLLTQAVALYGGDLLPGHYEEWALAERARRQEEFLGALRDLAAAWEACGDLERSLPCLRRIVEIDPLREEAWADWIRLVAAAGRPAEALQQYRQLEQRLRAELGEEPSEATRRLAARLRTEARTLERPMVSPRRSDPRPGMSSSSPAPSGSAASTSFSPVETSPAFPRLPLQLTRFFGREEEIARLVELLSPAPVPSTPCRLVTLTGPGGSGKTRLALEVAARLQAVFADAVWFVPLADLSDASLIPQALRTALGLPRSSEDDSLEPVVAASANRPALLILDNVEHLITASAEVITTLLGRAPHLICLVTSRQRLGLAGEQEWVVAPLPTPTGRDTPEQLTRYAGVQLFVDRAQAVRPDFQVTEANAAAIGALCARLEGIPLALELAASRIPVLTPAQMLAQLEHRFELLVGRRRDGDSRHQTLRSAMEWSYRLLEPEAQRFFARLSVFRGGWTVTAAAAVCLACAQDFPLFQSLGEGRANHALALLEDLQASSLVLTEERNGEMRFRMLETLREYGWEQLMPEERTELSRRHRDGFLALAEEAEPHLTGPEQAVWYERLDTERDNLRAAIACCQEDPEGAEAGLRMVGALCRFWQVRGHVAEGRKLSLNALSRVEAQGRTQARAKVLSRAGWLANAKEDFPAVGPLLEEGLAIAEELEDPSGCADALLGLGILAHHQGEKEQAIALIQRSLAIRQELGDRLGTARLTYILAVIESDDDSATVGTLLEEILAVSRELGDQLSIAASLRNLGVRAADRRAYPEALSFLEESLALFRELGGKGDHAYVLEHISDVALYLGDIERAQAAYDEGLALYREVENTRGQATIGSFLGHRLLLQGDYAAARAAYEGCLAGRRECGFGIAAGLVEVAHACWCQQDYPAARACLAEVIGLFQKHQDRQGLFIALLSFAGLAAAQGQDVRAARLFGAAEALRARLNHIILWWHRPQERILEAMREIAVSEDYAAARREGQALTLEQAVTYALAAESA